MIIKFDCINEKKLPQFKGGQGTLIARMFTDDKGKIMLGKLKPGSSIGLHTHETSSEIIYILQGKATYIFDGKNETALPGECHYCPKGHSHSMINNENEELVFLAIIPEQ